MVNKDEPIATDSDSNKSLPDNTVSDDKRETCDDNVSEGKTLSSTGDSDEQKAEENLEKETGSTVATTEVVIESGESADDEKNITIPENGPAVAVVAEAPPPTAGPNNCCSRGVASVEQAMHVFWKRSGRNIGTAAKIILLLLYLAFFVYCVQYRYFDEGSYILTVITAFILIKVVQSRIPCNACSNLFQRALLWYGAKTEAKKMRNILRYALYAIALVALCVYLGIEVIHTSPHNAQAMAGIFAMILLCFIFSARPSQVNWHPVYWGFIIQFFFATLTLRTEFGYSIFKWIGDLVNEFVRLSDRGSQFVLGASFLATDAGFFFDTAGVIVFFNACIFVLDFLGVMEFIVLKIGRALAFCLETGPVESVVAAANIFIGLSEAPLLIRPYLPIVTKSELHAIMTCGFASISGAFMAMFIKSGAQPSHLLTAAVISAPAALALSKLMYPETQTVDFSHQNNIRMKDENSPRNALQACSDGAAFSIKLVANIMVNMMAFVSILNLIDHILVWIGERCGIADFTFDYVSSYLLFPFAFLMGTEWDDCRQFAALIGVKLMATPFVAYRDLGDLIQNRLEFENYMSETNQTGLWHWSDDDIILDNTNKTLVDGFISERSEVILTYALCGISAFPAIGFTMGTLIPMCPPRKEEIVSIILRAFVAGNLANFVTGAVAGVMFSG